MSTESTSVHALSVRIRAATDWRDVETQAADVIRTYFDIPSRGRNAETISEVLARADVIVGPDGNGRFEATVTVRR